MNIKTLIKFVLLGSTVVFVGCHKKKNKKLSENYYKLALNHLEGEGNVTQRCKQALYSLDYAISNYPQPDYYALKATLLFQLGKDDAAEKCFREALRGDLDPKVKPDVLNNYACLLSQMGKIHEANSIWERLKRSRHYLTPEVALFNQAKLLISKGYYEQAKNRLSEALLYAPNYIDAHYYLAIVADRYLKNLTLAKRETDIVLALEPQHLGAQRLQNLLSDKI